MRGLRPFFLAAALVAAGCGDSGLSPTAERGRQIYLAQCVTCHASDPAHPGALGPPLRGTPRPVLEAKLLRGEYPPGYAPKRPTRLMPVLPGLAGELGSLAEFLR